MERLERIFPFLWLRDSTTRAEVAAEIEAIARCGVNAFCVESRIFSNFCRDPWWELMGFALAEAEKRGMQVWLLDDKRYPSGYANGGIAKRRALRQRHIFLKRVDVSGPKLLAKFLLRERGSDPADRLGGAYLVPWAYGEIFCLQRSPKAIIRCFCSSKDTAGRRFPITWIR